MDENFIGHVLGYMGLFHLRSSWGDGELNPLSILASILYFVWKAATCRKSPKCRKSRKCQKICKSRKILHENAEKYAKAEKYLGAGKAANAKIIFGFCGFFLVTLNKWQWSYFFLYLKAKKNIWKSSFPNVLFEIIDLQVELCLLNGFYYIFQILNQTN